MADTDDKPPETVADEPLKNDATTATAPNQDKGNEDAEALRKELEKSKMEANMLRNQNDKLAREREEAQRKELEEKEEWRTIAEQEKAKREALETEKQQAAKTVELESATKEIFNGFKPEVIELAQTAGLKLEDTTEEAKALLKDKLQAIADKVPAATVAGNNPTPPAPATNLNSEEVIKSMRYGNKEARREYIKQSPSIQAVKKELQRQVGVENL